MIDYLRAREWAQRSDLTGSTDRIASLREETGLTALTLKVCLNRGLETAEAIRDFLTPGFELLTSPLKIQDMDRATARLAHARAEGEHIRVYGDYDVDGTTGAALMFWVLRDFGYATFDVRQPDRFKDGYGLGVPAIEQAAADGVRVLVTVDCGITSFDAVARAVELGIDVIIVDHHQLDPRGMPAAHAVINPQRPDCESGLKQLCGCGLAFYVALALRARGRELGWFPAGADGVAKEPNLRQHLDLVVLATAADMVPLTGDNHVLIRHGMEVIKTSKKPGMRALLDAAGLVGREVSPGHLGWVLGPRINASGRMQNASIAFELLTTTEQSVAMKLARELEKLNDERAQLQNRIWDEVRARVEKGIADGKFLHGIVVADAAWHEGVVGIVASRVTETFRRPAAVIALREDFGKGSVRSYGGKDVLAALRASHDHLLGYGGHKHAAGLSVAPAQVEALAAAFDAALGAMPEDLSLKPLLLEGETSVEELSVRTLSELEKLGPFGPGNPEPVFSVRAAVHGHQVLKGRHLKLRLGTLDAIWFNAAERADVMAHIEGATGEAVTEWAGVPELNRFRGNCTPSFRVRDWRGLT